MKKKRRLAKRGKFHAHGSNPLKVYRRNLTDFQVRIRAECARQARLRDRQPAELAFEELLKELGLVDGTDYEKEKIIQNGDRFILIDFFIVGRNMAIEIDGRIHANQAVYDTGRTEWLREKGIATIRFKNREVLGCSGTFKERLKCILTDTRSQDA